jgi:DNA polymerase-3 subunit epsilon
MRFFFQPKKPVLETADQLVVDAYLAHFKKTSSGDTPLRTLRFVVLDLETTGLDIKKDRMLSVAALPVQGFQVEVGQALERFVFQQGYMPDTSIAVHGIMEKHLEGALAEKAILIELLDYLKDAIIVGHHIAFDLAVINKALQTHFHIKLKNKSLDTAALVRRIDGPTTGGQMPEKGPVSLDDLCAYFGIPLGRRHTSAEDTFITAMVFLKLLSRIEDRGVHTYRELMR